MVSGCRSCSFHSDVTASSTGSPVRTTTISRVLPLTASCCTNATPPSPPSPRRRWDGSARVMAGWRWAPRCRWACCPRGSRSTWLRSRPRWWSRRGDRCWCAISAKRWRTSRTLRVLAPLGLILENSPWLSISACTGSPGCARSAADVRADAALALDADSAVHRHCNLLRDKACLARIYQHRSHGEPRKRRSLFGDHGDPDQYRDDRRHRTCEGLQARRARRRGAGGRT
jgi:hypothetical protein